MEDLGQPVLVTTAHRGVFFGYLVGEPAKEKVLLKRARNCAYWSQDLRGFLGLAATGPGKDSKVGPAVGELTVFDVTSVSEVEAAAVAKWEAGPWA